jgi:hypothetical protein
MQRTPAISRWDNVLRDSQFGCTGGRQAADGGAPGSHRAGRKEKPHEDNRKKPRRAKFHRNHFCLCERKDIKGLQGKNRAELFGI